MGIVHRAASRSYCDFCIEALCISRMLCAGPYRITSQLLLCCCYCCCCWLFSTIFLFVSFLCSGHIALTALPTAHSPFCCSCSPLSQGILSLLLTLRYQFASTGSSEGIKNNRHVIPSLSLLCVSLYCVCFCAFLNSRFCVDIYRKQELYCE